MSDPLSALLASDDDDENVSSGAGSDLFSFSKAKVGKKSPANSGTNLFENDDDDDDDLFGRLAKNAKSAQEGAAVQPKRASKPAPKPASDEKVNKSPTGSSRQIFQSSKYPRQGKRKGRDQAQDLDGENRRKAVWWRYV